MQAPREPIPLRHRFRALAARRREDRGYHCSIFNVIVAAGAERPQGLVGGQLHMQASDASAKRGSRALLLHAIRRSFSACHGARLTARHGVGSQPEP